MKRLILVLLAAPLLPGCIIAVIGAAAAIASSATRDPISIQDGVATCDYKISFDRCWAGVEGALRGVEAVLDPVQRGAESASVRGRLKDGSPVEVTATRIYMATRIGVKVGVEDTIANREVAKKIHAGIDENLQVVRRHYTQGFDPVWDASQKSGVKVDQVIKPDNTIGQIQGKRDDGTPVIITVQKIDGSRTRITIEVGATASQNGTWQATELARAVSKALGVKSEEGD